MIGLVWAQSANGVIGRDNTIPWRLPEDLAHFKKVTMGATVLMGRRTWESLPPRFRPLPGRRNLVLTRDRDWHADGAEAVHDLESALVDDVWVIGGAQVYVESLPFADTAIVTELADHVQGDTYAPHLDETWLLESTDGWHVSASGLAYRWCTFRRQDHV
jgi:dihydrofolate reductase